VTVVPPFGFDQAFALVAAALCATLVAHRRVLRMASSRFAHSALGDMLGHGAVSPSDPQASSTSAQPADRLNRSELTSRASPTGHSRQGIVVRSMQIGTSPLSTLYDLARASPPQMPGVVRTGRRALVALAKVEEWIEAGGTAWKRN